MKLLTLLLLTSCATAKPTLKGPLVPESTLLRSYSETTYNPPVQYTRTIAVRNGESCWLLRGVTPSGIVVVDKTYPLPTK